MTPVDVVMKNDGRVWRFVGPSTVTTGDGREINTWRFETPCRVCNDIFSIDIVRSAPSAKRVGSFGCVHCEKHKLRHMPSTRPKKVAQVIKMRSGHVWTLVERTWYKSKRGKMLRLGRYLGASCSVCTSPFGVTSKLHCVGRRVSNYLRTTRCKQCRDRRLSIPGSDLT
jgi:hypothetical protein